MRFDSRITPARPDLAAAHLRGQVTAERFVEGERLRVRAASTALRKEPRPDVPYQTEALMGEIVTLYDRDDEGWGWGQLERDGYVGWLSLNALGPVDPAPTHRVIAPHAFLYPAASFKAQPLEAVSMGAELAVTRIEGRYAATPAGFIDAARIAPLPLTGGDFVAIAESLLHTPYLWGGKSAKGLDCSGLVQLSLAQTGVSAPRDSDMQERGLGTALPMEASGLRRGDLVFWKGHVAIMRDGVSMIHANASAMAVSIEVLADAIARIEAAGEGLPTAFRRP
jgi:cell wall-associated NlpC family hydrolase